MEYHTAPIKYFIYARKSSESDERQVQSIEDQISVLQQYAKALQLQIVDCLTEARSAKEPNNRPLFESLLTRIKKGEANGILVWKIDRLSRNPIDGANIQWLLQKQVLRSIKTPDREYRPEDNVLVLSVENSMATQYILDLSRNVKRGLQSRREKGWLPCMAPIGYLNSKTGNRGENYIVNDPKAFPALRKAWELMLTGAYLPREIAHILNTEWGFKTRQTKRRPAAGLTRSGIYKIFSNIFYAGIIDYKGSFLPGKHAPMITMEEFDRVQFLLGRKGKAHRTKHEYSYTGLIKCGECGGTITATYKRKYIRSTGKLKDYRLYYCFCAKRKNNCSQQLYTNADIIDAAIEEAIVSVTLDTRLKDLVFDILEENNTKDISGEDKIRNMQVDAIKKNEKQLSVLTQMRMQELITDDEFLSEKERLKNEIAILQSKLATDSPKKKYSELTKEVFEFSLYGLQKFRTGDNKVKREILTQMSGWNCTLIDKKLNIPKVEWLIPIDQKADLLKKKLDQLELGNSLTLQGQKRVFDDVSTDLRRLVDSVGTSLRTNSQSMESSHTNSIPILKKEYKLH